MGTPYCRDTISEWQQAVGVGGHILHGEVVVDKCPGQAEERQQQQQELSISKRTGRRHHAKAPPASAKQRVAAQQYGGGKGQDQCKLS